MKTRRRIVSRKNRKLRKTRKQRAGGEPWKCPYCGMRNTDGSQCMNCGASKN